MHKYFTLFIGILLIFGFIFLFAFRTPAERPLSEKPTVVTSFYPLYFFAHEIAGEHFHIKNLTPDGIEPHEYEPTPADLRTLEESTIVILNGAGLEAWGENVQRIIDPHTATVLTLLDEKASDPHFWLSPPLVKEKVTEIANMMITKDPTHKATYVANARALSEKLTQLHRDFEMGLATCTRRDFVTSHDAFGYIASTYNLTQVPIAGLSPEAEPSPKQLAEIATFVRARGVEVIFFERLASPKYSDTIAKETGARTLVLDPIEGISGNDQANGVDYFSLMRANLTNLKIALQCTP